MTKRHQFLIIFLAILFTITATFLANAEERLAGETKWVKMSGMIKVLDVDSESCPLVISNLYQDVFCLKNNNIVQQLLNEQMINERIMILGEWGLNNDFILSDYRFGTLDF